MKTFNSIDPWANLRGPHLIPSHSWTVCTVNGCYLLIKKLWQKVGEGCLAVQKLLLFSFIGSFIVIQFLCSLHCEKLNRSSQSIFLYFSLLLSVSVMSPFPDFFSSCCVKSFSDLKLLLWSLDPLFLEKWQIWFFKWACNTVILFLVFSILLCI